MLNIDLEHKRILKAIVALALFSFIFLGTEYMFDNMMAYVTDAEGVVTAQSYILGASVIGFLIFPVLYRIIKQNIQNIMVFSGAIVGIICIFVIWQHASYALTLAMGCILFVLFGIAGSAVHYLAICVLEKNKKYLARYVGIAYAVGIFFQFLNNNLVPNDVVQSIVLSVVLGIFVILLIRISDEAGWDKGEHSETEEIMVAKTEIKNPVIAGGALLVCVLLMTCIFSTLDVSVTLVHAAGSVDIGQWPRLLLAVSGLCAGFWYDIKERKYMGMLMYCVTLLSTICVVFIELGGSFISGLIIFYLSAGFFVVFFTAAFMDLAYYMKLPQLWAGLGRATNNLCAVLTGTISVTLLSAGGMAIIITALILFAFISIAVFVYSASIQLRPEEADNKEHKVEISDEERFITFSKAFSLTDREQEVLQILLISDENVQDIAVKLAISRAALYRHIASLNEKTDTKSRIGLLQFYYTWKREG